MVNMPRRTNNKPLHYYSFLLTRIAADIIGICADFLDTEGH